MKFTDLQFNTHPIGSGIQAFKFFPNGYGVSVVRFRGSYGYEDGLYEVAVLKGTDENNFEICYDTVVTDDVIGHQSEEQVEVLLYEVENL
jgi:hypothetical protein